MCARCSRCSEASDGQRVCFTGGLEAAALQDYQVDYARESASKAGDVLGLRSRAIPSTRSNTLLSRMLAAGWTRASHRLRCYVLIGYPRDTFAAAEQRLQDMVRIGFTPMAMLWKPETDAAMKWEPPHEWRAFQRRWVRPGIIHGTPTVKSGADSENLSVVGNSGEE
jgi:hypothetical protein